jgi:hypothetical protein
VFLGKRFQRKMADVAQFTMRARMPNGEEHSFGLSLALSPQFTRQQALERARLTFNNTVVERQLQVLRATPGLFPHLNVPDIAR